MIELDLKLPESRELNVQLLADVDELLFHGGKDFGSTDRWSHGAPFPALAFGAAPPGRTTFPALAALAAFARGAVFSLWPARSWLCRHCAQFYTHGMLAVPNHVK